MGFKKTITEPLKPNMAEIRHLGQVSIHVLYLALVTLKIILVPHVLAAMSLTEYLVRLINCNRNSPNFFDSR